MQTGKLALASYLDTFGAMESTECSCGRGRQDVRHILLHCTNKAAPRARHLTQGSRRELDYRFYLTRPDLAPKAVRFMLQTGLLGQFRAIVATYRVMITDPRQTSCPVQLRGHTLASVGMETRQYPASHGVLHGPGNSGIKRRTG